MAENCPLRVSVAPAFPKALLPLGSTLPLNLLLKAVAVGVRHYAVLNRP